MFFLPKAGKLNAWFLKNFEKYAKIIHFFNVRKTCLRIFESCPLAVSGGPIKLCIPANRNPACANGCENIVQNSRFFSFLQEFHEDHTFAITKSTDFDNEKSIQILHHTIFNVNANCKFQGSKERSGIGLISAERKILLDNP